MTVRVQTDDFDAHALAQTSEVYAYIANSGHFPRRARVLTGHTAAVVSEVRDSGQRRLWAPCLGFPSATFSTVQLIAAGLVPWKRIIIDGEIDDGLAAFFGAPWYMGRLAESDIVMPRNSSASSSRAIMAHEYGHFVACSLMNEQDPDSLGILTVDVLFEGDELDPEDEARYLTESFADFVAGQVTGGVNYFEPPNAIESGVCHFCSGAGTCLDANLNGEDTGTNQIGRVVTTYHDAFDGTERGTLPTNGDSFRLETSPSGETCDSTPAAGGSSIFNVENADEFGWLDALAGGSNVAPIAFLYGALGATVNGCSAGISLEIDSRRRTSDVTAVSEPGNDPFFYLRREVFVDEACEFSSCLNEFVVSIRKPP